MSATRHIPVATGRKKTVPLSEDVDFNPRFGKDELNSVLAA